MPSGDGLLRELHPARARVAEIGDLVDQIQVVVGQRPVGAREVAGLVSDIDRIVHDCRPSSCP